MKVRFAAASLACGAVLAGCSAEEGTITPAQHTALVEALHSEVERAAEERAAEQRAADERAAVPGYEIARVVPGGQVVIRRSPGGPVAARPGDSTEFGTQLHFWVAKRSGPWLGVTTSELPNGELGWIRDDPRAIETFRSPYAIHADVSRGELALTSGKRVVELFDVGVGRSDSPTPLGAYSVTDGLVGDGVEAYYGCCVLALTGHQPNLPAGWPGGDRMAIHSTPDRQGGGSSAGCLRASDEEMARLFAHVPLGTPVFIRG